MRQPKNECTCENCTCKDVEADLNYLHEEILGLAEDIMDLDEEKEDFIDWANTFADSYNSALDDIDKNFSTLQNGIEQVDNAGWYLFLILVIWNIMLSILFALLYFNVL